MDPRGQTVVGRVVGWDPVNSRPIVQIPPGGSPYVSMWERVEKLLAAARAFKGTRTRESLQALADAAEDIE